MDFVGQSLLVYMILIGLRLRVKKCYVVEQTMFILLVRTKDIN